MSAEELKTSDSESESPSNPKAGKVCKVCGDKALGYNFNAVTCESCKAFFRRNALKNKEFKCPFNKKCEINPITRRFCQLCRLIKCFEIGMKKEYIMSEDDKREKRQKIEKNRAIKKRAADSDVSSPDTTKSAKLEKNEEDEENEGKKTPSIQPAKLNLLNMASASKKTYEKKQIKYSTNVEQLIPFPSPGLPEPSPENISVTESRTCNVFNENNTQRESSQSRPVEIYQISKSSDGNKTQEGYEKDCGDSSLIQIILDSEFFKPSAVYPESKIGRRGEEGVCNYGNNVQTGGDIVISEANILGSGSKNIMLETTKDGKRILVISKDSLVAMKGKADKSCRSKCGENEAATPLLTSLINSRRSSDAKLSGTSTKPAEEILQDIPRNSASCLSNSIDSILSEAIKLEYEAYTSMNTRINSRELNDAERAKLNELIVANKALLAPLEDDMTGDDFGFNAIQGCGPSMLVDVLNLTAVAIRRLIKMSKKINAFKNMCQDDQIALLKGGCTEMMILRSAMTYDPDRDSWKIPQSKEKLMNIKVDVLKEAGGKVFEEHQRFLQTFDQKWRNDENIMLILSAIALFTPDRPRVVHYDVIKLEQTACPIRRSHPYTVKRKVWCNELQQLSHPRSALLLDNGRPHTAAETGENENSYYYLLRRYLESIHQGCEARLTFLKLIHKISELHKLNEDHVRVYLDVNPKEIEPLLIEIFDLKPH